MPYTQARARILDQMQAPPEAFHPDARLTVAFGSFETGDCEPAMVWTEQSPETGDGVPDCPFIYDCGRVEYTMKAV